MLWCCLVRLLSCKRLHVYRYTHRHTHTAERLHCLDHSEQLPIQQCGMRQSYIFLSVDSALFTLGPAKLNSLFRSHETPRELTLPRCRGRSCVAASSEWRHRIDRQTDGRTGGSMQCQLHGLAVREQHNAVDDCLRQRSAQLLVDCVLVRYFSDAGRTAVQCKASVDRSVWHWTDQSITLRVRLLARSVRVRSFVCAVLTTCAKNSPGRLTARLAAVEGAHSLLPTSVTLCQPLHLYVLGLSLSCTWPLLYHGTQ